MDHNEQLAHKPDDMKVKDHAFTIPRSDMSNGKDNYALDFDCMEKANEKKLNGTTEITVEADVVKKVAGKQRTKFYKLMD